VIEKLFDLYKTEHDGYRVRTENEHTTEGKTFVNFIAAIIRLAIMTKISFYLQKVEPSIRIVLAKLNNIMISTNGTTKRLIKPLTKQQKEILSALDAVNEFNVRLK
jgi:hypothetical protein